jgi:hypothetical protein
MDAITASQEASGNLTNITGRGIIVYEYIEYQSACIPSPELGPPPEQSIMSPSLDPKGEQHSLACEELVGPNSEDWTESLALCTHTLCVQPNRFHGLHIGQGYSFLMHSSPTAAKWRGVLTVAENLLFWSMQSSVPKVTSYVVNKILARIQYVYSKARYYLGGSVPFAIWGLKV